MFGLVSQNAPDVVNIQNFQGVYMSPQQAKALMNVLQQNISQYESAFGEIHIEPQQPHSPPPQPVTLAASANTIHGATLNASVVPNGTASVYFEYGPTAAYGSTVAVPNVSGGEAQGVSAVVSGLAPNATYHFRVVATNTAGMAAGGWPIATSCAGVGGRGRRSTGSTCAFTSRTCGEKSSRAKDLPN